MNEWIALGIYLVLTIQSIFVNACLHNSCLPHLDRNTYLPRPPLIAPRNRSLNVPLDAAAAGELLRKELPSIIELLPSSPKLLLPWPKSTPRSNPLAGPRLDDPMPIPTPAPTPIPLGKPELRRPDERLPLSLRDRLDSTELKPGRRLASSSLESSSSESVCS